MTEDVKKPLGRILIQQRALTPAQLERALADHVPGGPPLASRLTEAGTVTELAALKALSEQSGVPGMDLSRVCIRLSDLAILPREIAVRHKLLPLLVRGERIFLAMASPTDKKAIDELEFVTDKRVFPYIALAGPLMRLIATAYEMRERGESYYVGPSCPADVLRRAGVSAVPPSEPSCSPPVAQPTRLAGASRSGNWTPLVDEVLLGDSGIRGDTPHPGLRGDTPHPGIRGDTPHPGLRGDTPHPGADWVADSGPPSSRAESSFRPAQALASPPAPVVVDDAMGRMVVADELTDTGFGEAHRDLSVASELPKAEVPRAEQGQRTVLIVDDEPDIRRLLKRVFEERGYRVLEADRGLPALRLVKEQSPDVMILDAMLPEVHGFEIARRVKGTKLYGHIPIVMISAVYRGWRFAEDLKTSYGVEAYIEKPFKVSMVVAAVETALSQTLRRTDSEQMSADAERHLQSGIGAYQSGDVARAIEHLLEGTRIDPLAYRLHFHLGLLYGKQGQVYDAIQELETALHINDRHFPGLKNLAVLYQKAGFRNKAIETWERALGVAPDEPTRQSIKEHLLGLL